MGRKRKKGNGRAGAKRRRPRPCTLERFRCDYVWNDRRQELFLNLLDEIESIRKQSKQRRVFVFGSFLTSKRIPGDLDLLLSYEPTSIPPKLVRVHPNDIQIKSNARMAFGKPVILDSKEAAIRDFNSDPANIQNHIFLSSTQVRELLI
jgi:hypothetical protein